MGDLSPHFSRSEFRCRHCGLLQPDTRLRHLVGHLERLREICGGKPMRIVSGYRCPTHNAAVGGARASRHMYGDAVDLPRGYARPEQARAAGLHGVGILQGWATHVDDRPAPGATWYY